VHLVFAIKPGSPPLETSSHVQVRAIYVIPIRRPAAGGGVSAMTMPHPATHHSLAPPIFAAIHACRNAPARPIPIPAAYSLAGVRMILIQDLVCAYAKGQMDRLPAHTLSPTNPHLMPCAIAPAAHIKFRVFYAMEHLMALCAGPVNGSIQVTL